MRPRIRRAPTRMVAVGATVLAALTLVADGAAAASAQANSRESISAVSQISCDGTTAPGARSRGFANIRLGEGDMVVAEVSLQDALPNRDYEVSLIQSAPRSSCGPARSMNVRTNNQGNANVRLSAPRIAGRTGAFVSTLGPGPILVSTTYVFPAS
ncbi:MAG: hypothetical protein ABJA74_14665 [Lapillicoccus sp.]